MLLNNGIDFFTGVPDSLLKNIIACIIDNSPIGKNIIAANEGNAIALAAGYHLATGNIGLVYMQNSGLGNAINPLVSLSDVDVYSIPIVLLIGWRGEPGESDEPQHLKQGKITLRLLDTLGIPFEILPREYKDAKVVLKSIVNRCYRYHKPYALVVKKRTFRSYKVKSKSNIAYNLSREEALKFIIDHIGKEDIVISTTGKTSRELFEYREKLKEGHHRDFLTVGSMGHASQIACAISMMKTSKQVFCLDGDGALLMHMGALAVIGFHGKRNFKHIVINNGSHDSVGGQPTVALKINIPGLAKACGYKFALSAESIAELEDNLEFLKHCEGPALLEIKVKAGSRKDLGRPTSSPQDNKKDFMNFLIK